MMSWLRLLGRLLELLRARYDLPGLRFGDGGVVLARGDRRGPLVESEPELGRRPTLPYKAETE